MSVSSETLLALLIVALYLKDRLLLLDVNEAVLSSRGGARWSASFGARTWKIAGREPFIANPLAPDLAVFRLRWKLRGNPGKANIASGIPIEMPAELKRIGYFAWISWFVLFAILPTALIGRLGPTVTVLAIGLLYLNILASLARVWIFRQALGIGSKAFYVLAFECIACAPYAANLVRRLAAMRPVDEDFELAARRLLDAKSLAKAKAQCLARIDEQLESVEAGDRDFDALQQARRRFLEADREPG